MSVVAPISGTPILAGDIEAMHEVVRDIVNAMTSTECGRAVFGPHNLPSLVRASDQQAVNAPVIINIEPANFEETQANILAQWQNLGPGGYLLNNGGAGYALPPGILFMYFTCHVNQWAAGHNLHLYDSVFFSLSYTLGGATYADPGETGYLQDTHLGSTIDGTQAIRTGLTCSIVKCIEIVANQTLNEMRIWAAKVDLSAGTCPDVSVDGGNLGFIHLYQQS